VEKPLALTAEELDRITEMIATTGNDRLMVGFNRRFAPLLAKMKTEFGPASSSTRYLVNAGSLAADSWYRDEGEGSRFTGEGGHFLDTLSWWTGSLPEEVYAVGGGPDSDDVQVTVRFANGASGVISYLTGGNVRFPKETLDATGGGRSARLDNFRKATVWAGRGHETTRARSQDKGQQAEVARFVEACLSGAAMPIPLESLAATTRATIAVRDSLLSGKPEQV
jgi:predicted dehydrogenase